VSLRLRSCYLCSTFLLTFTLFLSPRAFAGEGFQPVSPQELKMTAEPQAPGAPAVILYRQVDRDDSGHTAHEFNYARVKILKEEGRKYADIEIPFFKENGNNLVNVHGRPIRPDGSIVDFAGKIFEKTIAKAKGLKYLAKTFTLPDVQVGGIIEYYYTYDFSERYVYDSHWILSHELFTKHAKFSLKPYRSPYINFSLHWSWQGLPPGTAPPPKVRITLCVWKPATFRPSRQKTLCPQRTNSKLASILRIVTCPAKRIPTDSGRRSAAL
jgi:Domain of Unknown Function with PDB structure (DUF3857)